MYVFFKSEREFSMVGKEVSEVKLICERCGSKLCEELYWKDIIISPNFFEVPFDCPLRTEDEFIITTELNKLSEFEVSNISGDLWVKYNYTPRYFCTSNHKREEIDYILQHVRNRRCVVICKVVAPYYEPWKLFGFWSNRVEWFEIAKSLKKEEEALTDSLADELALIKQSLKITSVSWRHKDTTLRKESPDIAYNGNTIELLAELENYIDGTAVDFIIYVRSNDTEKQLTTIHTSCKRNLAIGEWLVDTSENDTENPQIEFECLAGERKSSRCPINIGGKRLGGFCAHLKNENWELIKGINVTIYSDDEEIYSGELSDGIIEVNDLPESKVVIEYENQGQKIKQPIKWICGKGPYLAEVIIIEERKEGKER